MNRSGVVCSCLLRSTRAHPRGTPPSEGSANNHCLPDINHAPGDYYHHKSSQTRCTEWTKIVGLP
jgi:hypothetical protein